MRPRQFAPVLQIALAFASGVISFSIVSLTLIAVGPTVLVVGFGVILLALFLAVFRRWGVAYAVPVALAALVAYDWFQFPPTHAEEFPSAGDLATLVTYLAAAVLFGQLPAFASRRADMSEAERGRLADEQAALRRVASLVARRVPAQELFAAVAAEAGLLLAVDATHIGRYEPDGTTVGVGSWSRHGDHMPPGTRAGMDNGSVSAVVQRTGRPARVNDYSAASGALAASMDERGFRSSVGVPIVTELEPWGVMVVSSKHRAPLPADTEARTAVFAELVATAIANSETRSEVERLAEEQAALRRVATLVAEDVPPEDLFAAVAREVGTITGADLAGMARIDPPNVVTVAAWAASGEHPPVPDRWEMQPGDPATTIAETRAPARWDDWTGVPGPIASFIRDEVGVRSTVGCPIVVEGRLWGAMAVHSKQRPPLPPDTEARLAQFTDLVGTAIANAEARAEVARLAREQAALRRVATLVAKEAAPADVFAKVTEELANALGDVDCSLFRDEGDGTATAVALSGARVSAAVPVGTRLPVDGDGVIASVLRDGRPCRIGDYSAPTGAIAERGRELGIRSAVGCPIVVGGRIWGAMGAARYEGDAFPPEAETRIEQFADLVATAIANADARAEVARLAEEQAARRRVATLVAEGSSPTAVFDAVAAEVEALMDADGVMLSRYEPDDEVTLVAHRGSRAERVPAGTRVRHTGDNVTTKVRRSERPARMDDLGETSGVIAELVETLAVRSAVGAPIVVDGQLWGVIIAHWTGEEAPPPGTEERMAHFADLLESAIANADSREQLKASRARLLAAGDEARRRLVRDLHDGAQQRLVHTIIVLKQAARALRENDDGVQALVSEAIEQGTQANAELRELAHGILPNVLTRGGLAAGVDALVSRSPVPVKVGLPKERFSAEVEATAYFVVAEALTNVAKHAHAQSAEVGARLANGALRIDVRDDGVGGADLDGPGLLGLADRIAVLDGELKVESPPGRGTHVVATIPVHR